MSGNIINIIVGIDPSNPIAPRQCPITGRAFYDNMEHPDLGWIAMYGGPLDVYSIPSLGSDDELRVERYDLDADAWIEGGEPIGYFYRDQQPDHAAEIARLRAELEKSAKAVDDRFPNGLPDAIEYADEMEEAASAVYEKVFGHEDDGEDCGTVVLRRVLHHLNQQPAQAVDLAQFRSLARWVANCAGHGINDSQRRMGEKLLALIDSHSAGGSL